MWAVFYVKIMSFNHSLNSFFIIFSFFVVFFFCSMSRIYKRKTNRKTTSPTKLQGAVDLVKAGWSVRQAAKYKNVNRQTLWRMTQKIKNATDPDSISFKLSYNSRNVFTLEVEKDIENYCIEIARMGYGLSVLKVRELAFEVADKNKIKM